jgi:arabinogalactan endo-1,4-beta-galactosidase
MMNRLRFGLMVCLLSLMALVVDQRATVAAESTQFYRGVDLSYVNEMEDCGAVYHVDGEARDPYQIFFDYGANLVRLRLWHSPTWTKYSTLDDVIRSIKRAKALGMQVLLDFHYSDTWADPSKQIIPAAWAKITNQHELGQALHDYTYDTLMQLDSMGLLPEMVQVGNEINSEILRAENSSGYPINWERNAFLLNTAIQAVREASTKSDKPIRVMIHVAQPENVEGWLLSASDAGVNDFDIVGMSYYTAYSNHTIKTLGNVIRKIATQFGKDILIAEAAYPWTFDSAGDSAGNIVNSKSLEDGYLATPDGQRQFMIDLTQTVLANGGIGVVYWEPAWVSTKCPTLWGQGSHWENATFFDFHKDNEVLSGIEFLQHDYTYPVEVRIRFHSETSDPQDKIYFWGSFTGFGKRTVIVTAKDGVYEMRALLPPNMPIQYQFYSALPASAETMLIKGECVTTDGAVSATMTTSEVVIEHRDHGCGE